MFVWLVFPVFLAGSACQGGAQEPCPSTPEPEARSSFEGSAPVIGISGYVILPGTRGDDGLGSFRVTRTYRDAVARAGAVPVHLVPVPLDRVGHLLHRIDALVLAGGPDIDPALYDEEPHPTVSMVPQERLEFDMALIREAMDRQMPILGICLGSQELNVALGGALIQDIPSEVEGEVGHRRLDLEDLRAGVHEITIVAGTRLDGLYEPETIRVNSAHHQASDVLGEGLVPAARAADGVVEAFELPDYPFLIGVQFHPEIQTEPAGLHDALFLALVEAATTYRRSR